MSLSQRSSSNADILFSARVDNVKTLLQILKAINFKDQAIFYCTDHGLKVTVEDTKCVQASAFIQAEIFQEYTFNKRGEDDIITFKINLSVVLECLNIFGSGSAGGGITTLRMSYEGYGNPFKMLVEEDGVITNCTIKTLEAEEVLDFNFDHSNVMNKVILKSDSLKEVMNDLDMSSDIVEILLSPDAPYFRFVTVGDAGETQADIPKDCDIIESFQCTSAIRSSYKLSHIKPSMKPLTVSNKVSVRIDERGLLCFQYMIKTEDNNTCFVEYYCTPVIEMNGDED